ncbi:SIMPL domain-containing protein [Nocardia camponoti]|uniref:DUF541 domain-containing protein n=1 Tax=Nocardia camponoti TaxID=1616106 RepID=A0A917QB83_9NOCA|nr:SIMPL domain-containing protein [Nocardia camponoti]GGK40869.1 hypothetical protein GCM10011591_10640 [Nocardia camponoti]
MTHPEPLVPSITMSGRGTVRAVPDVVELSLAVQTRAGRVVAAYEEAGRVITAVLQALRDAGVDEKDTATTGLSIDPETRYSERKGNEIVGYAASSRIRVALREGVVDPATAIAAAVHAGGDAIRLDGLTRTVADPAPLLTQARDLAFDDARAKAEQYATRADVALGPVLEITEHTGTASPPPMRAREVALMASASAVPVVAGETEVDATVRVTWALRAPDRSLARSHFQNVAG